MKKSNAKPLAGRRGAAEIPRHQRALLAVLGFVSAFGGWLLTIRPHSPELGGTALFVIAALALALAVIGRLPKILEVAGVPLEFDRDEMSEFLVTLRANVDEDTVEVLEDKLRRMSANAKSFDAAQQIADQSQDAVEDEVDQAPDAAQPQSADLGRKPTWLESLEAESHNATVEMEARVLGGYGSGRGQPPRVGALVRFDDERVLVREAITVANDSTLDVLRRRLNRVMANSPTVKKLVVLVPVSELRTVARWRNDVWGTTAELRVEVLAEGSPEAVALEAWIARLPIWARQG